MVSRSARLRRAQLLENGARLVDRRVELEDPARGLDRFFRSDGAVAVEIRGDRPDQGVLRLESRRLFDALERAAVILLQHERDSEHAAREARLGPKRGGGRVIEDRRLEGLRVLLLAEVHEREPAPHEVHAEVVRLEVESAIEQLSPLLLATRHVEEDHAEAADLGIPERWPSSFSSRNAREIVGFVGPELRLGFAEIPVPRVVLDRHHDLQNLGRRLGQRRVGSSCGVPQRVVERVERERHRAPELRVARAQGRELGTSPSRRRRAGRSAGRSPSRPSGTGARRASDRSSRHGPRIAGPP